MVDRNQKLLRPHSLVVAEASGAGVVAVSEVETEAVSEAVEEALGVAAVVASEAALVVGMTLVVVDVVVSEEVSGKFWLSLMN